MPSKIVKSYVIPVMVSLCTACTADIVVQSDKEPAGILQKVIWVIEPSLEYEDIDNVIQGYYRQPSRACWYLEMTGYSSSWQNHTSDIVNAEYPSNMFTCTLNGRYGILDDEGKMLLDGIEPLQSYAGEKNPLEAKEYYSYIVKQNGVLYQLNQDMTAGEEVTHGMMAGDYPFHPFVMHQEVFIYNMYMYEDASFIKPFKEVDVSYLNLPDICYVPVVDNCTNFTDDVWTGMAKMDNEGNILQIYDYVPCNGIQNTDSLVNGYYVTAHEPVDITCMTDIYSKDIASKDIVSLETGEIINAEPYQDVLWFEDGYCPVMKDGKWGFIDETGTEVTEFIFEDVTALYHGKSYVKYTCRYGLLDVAGTLEKGTEISSSTCKV